MNTNTFFGGSAGAGAAGVSAGAATAALACTATARAPGRGLAAPLPPLSSASGARASAFSAAACAPRASGAGQPARRRVAHAAPHGSLHWDAAASAALPAAALTSLKLPRTRACGRVADAHALMPTRRSGLRRPALERPLAAAARWRAAQSGRQRLTPRMMQKRKGAARPAQHVFKVWHGSRGGPGSLGRSRG